MQASTPGRAPPPRALTLAIAVLAAALALAGCNSMRSKSPQARKDAETAARLLQLQQQNMRFADNYVMRLIEAARKSEGLAADPVQRHGLSGWMLAQATTAYSAASGDNAAMATLDLVALATISPPPASLCRRSATFTASPITVYSSLPPPPIAPATT